MTVYCYICMERVGVSCGMCRQCARSYDRDQATNDGTLMATLEWSAKRARWFERRRGQRKAKR